MRPTETLIFTLRAEAQELRWDGDDRATLLEDAAAALNLSIGGAARSKDLSPAAAVASILRMVGKRVIGAATSLEEPAICPVCSCEHVTLGGGPDSKKLEMFRRYLSEDDYRHEINERAGNAPEVSWVPFDDTQIDGAKFERSRLWVFSCPLCECEYPTHLMIYEENPHG